ncbi:hypothetical protein FRUB_03378 [Fimbriiglobus ruber]|uniref:Uncharacterized protein n=1 Tax=Fimbriiglobus ruber TaxID=1908690 RepID=A0A225E2R7_9BACT|nr:hypothetical protein FRUB_03378 [Fimbriiglobus ruber]
MNTNGLNKTKSKIYDNSATSIDYFKSLILPAYDEYEKRSRKSGKIPESLDLWLKKEHERYSERN